MRMAASAAGTVTSRVVTTSRPTALLPGTQPTGRASRSAMALLASRAMRQPSTYVSMPMDRPAAGYQPRHVPPAQARGGGPSTAPPRLPLLLSTAACSALTVAALLMFERTRTWLAGAVPHVMGNITPMEVIGVCAAISAFIASCYTAWDMLVAFIRRAITLATNTEAAVLMAEDMVVLKDGQQRLEQRVENGQQRLEQRVEDVQQRLEQRVENAQQRLEGGQQRLEQLIKEVKNDRTSEVLQAAMLAISAVSKQDNGGDGKS